ncbi:MAG: hypothetical protein MJ183_04610 [Treponemataceae bacterium]|nr:hypothetical protein [Treponemataceae bacterium]
MRVIDLKNVNRDEGFIYYRRTFLADAVIELPLVTVTVPVEFTIEMTPLGSKEIDIELKDSVDYPLVPLLKQLKECILNKDSEGQLP